MAETGATAWRWLIAGEFRAFPMRFVLPGLAIAIGVALAFAVHVINRSAAESFGQAVRSAGGPDCAMKTFLKAVRHEDLPESGSFSDAASRFRPPVFLRRTP